MPTAYQNDRYNPCHKCPDRYPACSGHCQKPEFLEWKEEQEKIRKARKDYRPPKWKHPEPIHPRKFGPSRKR